MNLVWLALAIVGHHWLNAKPTPTGITSDTNPAPTEAGDRMTVRPIVRITDETTRADLADTLAILNAEAKAMRRKGFVGVASAAYAIQHERINAVLGDLLGTPSDVECR